MPRPSPTSRLGAATPSILALPLLAIFAVFLTTCHACTNILVSPGASHDASTLLAYNADSGSLYGSLGHYPAGKHAATATRDVWDWDDSVFLGTIPEAAHTFNVIGNANEAGAYTRSHLSST